MVTPLRLMAVLAHPDDESLGMGGTLARYAAEGVETYLVTGTLGQSGRFHGLPPGEPGHPGAEELGRIRERELRAAANVLGIREVTLLGYHDQFLDRADPRQAIGRIAAELRRVRPQVVATFGADGAYGHPDHVAISQFTSAAVVAAADPSWPGVPGGENSAPHAITKSYVMAWPAAAMSAYQEAFRKLTSRV
ncbi:MAG: PIG-L deacetylase family protein, partial [Candidatus Eiseniibacteriota bacterium]